MEGGGRGDRYMIRKGPWKSEEDEVLQKHVNKYGPRDWSSIRSKGLLQRTGKSCRLRWVNKLRPNLKTGCKFSVEEERVVIELQAQFGNKWAKIATYLPGRTDNDVKNFWSSRQKKLARILHNSTTTSSSSNKSHKHKKDLSFCHDPHVPTLKDPALMFSSEAESSSQPRPESGTMKIVALQDLVGPLPENIPFLVPPVPPQLPLVPLPDFTFSSESQELMASLDEPFFCDMLGVDNDMQFPIGQPVFEQMRGFQSSARENVIDTSAASKIFFDDFPEGMFDQIEPLPSLSKQ